MDNLSLFFMDLWTFAFSQIGLVALGFILRGWAIRRDARKAAATKKIDAIQ